MTLLTYDWIVLYGISNMPESFILKSKTLQVLLNFEKYLLFRDCLSEKSADVRTGMSCDLEILHKDVYLNVIYTGKISSPKV